MQKVHLRIALNFYDNFSETYNSKKNIVFLTRYKMRRSAPASSRSSRRPRIQVDDVTGVRDQVLSTQVHPVTSTSNFYILPKEIYDFLTRSAHPELFVDDDRLSLLALNEYFAELESMPQKYVTFWRDDRSDPEFLVNEYLKLHAKSRDTKKSKWLFPHLTGWNGSTLVIPHKDVFDLPIYIMLYILRRLAQTAVTTPSFIVSYNLETDASTAISSRTSYPIYHHNDDGHPVSVVNSAITLEDLTQIYLMIMRRFASFFPEGEASWNGTDESGTRIMFNGGFIAPFRLKLVFTPTRSVNRGHGWTQEVENLLAENVGSSVISVRNRDDNLCLIYCLIMGLIMKIKGEMRTFGVGKLMVESNEVYAKGMYLFADVSDKVTAQIHKLAKLLLPPNYSVGDPTELPLIHFVGDIDKKAGTMISVCDFRKEFGEIEEKLIDPSICGIDVYGIDYNINSHIYPLYMSKNRNKVIELLCVTPPQTQCSHYCLIVNREQLMRNAGGKQFFSCSKCGQCFYHRRLLGAHNCPFQRELNKMPGEGDYHFSTKTAKASDENVVGVCTKCRLCFTDNFALEYHKEHCFMSNQTGYRHVQLITYDENEHPKLKGEDLNEEEENKHVLRRRVMYADFESSIDPETGDHSFMSYGVFDTVSEEYKCGYSIQEFIDFIVDKAFESAEKDQVYVYFHNAMGYDANFVLRHILKNEQYSKWGVRVIMKSMNRLQKLVFHVCRDQQTKSIHIGDTFLFLTLSLDRIVSSIRKDELELNMDNFSSFFEVFRGRYPWASFQEIDHILRKNIFPYKFFTDSSKLTTSYEEFLAIFEPKEENLKYFSERVTLEDLTKGFNDTKHVMDTFRCRTARDYHDLYLCCDVMQLADVFERSMDILWDSHHIHLTRYIGMPSASWAAFLRHDPTMEIPLYEDTFFAEFFKGMIRGGITSAAVRYSKADRNHSIIYLDVNGLYPFVMQKYLFPCGQFRFINLGWAGPELCKDELFKLFDHFEHPEDGPCGMCFCVDMVIPESVKQLTDMYPFAPEHRRIYKEYFCENEDGEKELTPFLKHWSEANEGEKMAEFTGLVCTLYDKTKYNVHWRVLKFYMEHGVIVTKVHFAVAFEEGDYLAGYIRKNIAIRNTRKDELGKTLYKLLGNSIYGKTFESPFKRNTYEIVRDPIKLQGLLEEGNIAAVTPIDDFAWIVRMDGENIILDKPTFIGACVCEFAKLHMYTLLYDKLMAIFPPVNGEFGCQMIYTDTDSFIVSVRHPPGLVVNKPEDLFAYIKSKDPELIGGIGGQVKSETGEDDTIDEIIALRSKVYAYKTIHGHLGKRAKGTTHDAQELQLDWETYKRALDSLTSIDTRNIQFVRKTFKVASLEVFRQSLSVNDGKRYICKDGIHTHAFGFPLPMDELQ